MIASRDALNQIKEFEGFSAIAYRCAAGVLTVGYGHTSAAGSPKVVEGMVVSKPEAERILRMDMQKFEIGVDHAVTVPLKQNQFDALVSLAFNIGMPAFNKSTLLKKLNRGDYEAVPAEIMKWNKVGGREIMGLTRRRRAETKMWRGIDKSEPVNTEEARETPDAPQPKKSIVQSREANAAFFGGSMSALAAGAEATGNSRSIADNFDLPIFWVLVAVAVIFAAVWLFRWQRLRENGE